MKMVGLVLILVLSFGGANAQKTKCVPTTTPPRDKAVRLRLTTTVAEAHHLVEDGSKSLLLTLNLDYVNIGSRPILIDKKSSQIYRKIVTKNVKALAACKYLYDAVSHPISAEDMRRAGFRSDIGPERSEFVVLKPGESFSLKKQIGLYLYDGTRDTKDDLHPGNYVLQVRVAAWFYFADPAEWEQKWGGEAYLWSENVTSEPMAFTVEKR
ncbi:MAG TPA: hypothetical protein VN844_04450 [Pyrinomonadaceae bacterium]|nr:hypothetical protein [Pyrinomonadaceae bacterium]